MTISVSRILNFASNNSFVRELSQDNASDETIYGSTETMDSLYTTTPD